MITSGWNCQGMNTSRAVLALLEVQRQIKPDVMFLSESHLSKSKAEKLMRKLKFDRLLAHESDGRSGGLILMWKKEIKIVPKDITANFIDVVIEGVNEWRLTCFYGEPKWEDKHLSWSYLRDRKSVV